MLCLFADQDYTGKSNRYSAIQDNLSATNQILSAMEFLINDVFTAF